jgi:hypothetical protein
MLLFSYSPLLLLDIGGLPIGRDFSPSLFLLHQDLRSKKKKKNAGPRSLSYLPLHRRARDTVLHNQ